jgi:biopolymer transport protein ExbD
MNFSKRSKSDEPEINLIPFIDVLLVVLIFLMLSTTYSKFTELQVKLPTADAGQAKDYPKEIIVAVSSDGRYAVGKQTVDGKGMQPVAQLLREAAAGSKNTVVIISADALASHQSVMTVMEAAKAAGLSQVTFAAQQSQ